MNFFQFFVKYSIYHPLSADTSFKFLALILFEIRHLQNFIPLSKGRNLTRGDNSGKTRNTRRLFFHEESIHKDSRRYLEHEYVRTYVRKDKPKPICPLLFQSWGHNKLNLEPFRNASYEYQIKENLGNAISPYGP